MLLKNKTAVIYGAGGAIGGTVSRAFAREGAKVFMTGRTLDKLEKLAREITTDQLWHNRGLTPRKLTTSAKRIIERKTPTQNQ